MLVRDDSLILVMSSLDSVHLMNENPINGRSFPENNLGFFIAGGMSANESSSSSKLSKFDKSSSPVSDGIQGGTPY